MPAKDLPDIVLIHEEDFLDFLKSRGGNNVPEPIPAAPLHGTKGVQLILGEQVPKGTTIIRKDRRWLRLRRDEEAPPVG